MVVATAVVRHRFHRVVGLPLNIKAIKTSDGMTKHFSFIFTARPALNFNSLRINSIVKMDFGTNVTKSCIQFEIRRVTHTFACIQSYDSRLKCGFHSQRISKVLKREERKQDGSYMECYKTRVSLSRNTIWDIS